MNANDLRGHSGLTDNQAVVAEKLLGFFVQRRLKLAPTPHQSLDVDFIGSQFIDSLGIVELLSFVESEFDVSLAAEHLESTKMHTVRGITELVEGLQAGVASCTTH